MPGNSARRYTLVTQQQIQDLCTKFRVERENSLKLSAEVRKAEENARKAQTEFNGAENDLWNAVQLRRVAADLEFQQKLQEKEQIQITIGDSQHRNLIQESREFIKEANTALSVYLFKRAIYDPDKKVDVLGYDKLDKNSLLKPDNYASYRSKVARHFLNRYCDERSPYQSQLVDGLRTEMLRRLSRYIEVKHKDNREGITEGEQKKISEDVRKIIEIFGTLLDNKEKNIEEKIREIQDSSSEYSTLLDILSPNRKEHVLGMIRTLIEASEESSEKQHDKVAEYLRSRRGWKRSAVFYDMMRKDKKGDRSRVSDVLLWNKVGGIFSRNDSDQGSSTAHIELLLEKIKGHQELDDNDKCLIKDVLKALKLKGVIGLEEQHEKLELILLNQELRTDQYLEAFPRAFQKGVFQTRSDRVISFTQELFNFDSAYQVKDHMKAMESLRCLGDNKSIMGDEKAAEVKKFLNTLKSPYSRLCKVRSDIANLRKERDLLEVVNKDSLEASADFMQNNRALRKPHKTLNNMKATLHKANDRFSNMEKKFNESQEKLRKLKNRLTVALGAYRNHKKKARKNDKGLERAEEFELALKESKTSTELFSQLQAVKQQQIAGSSWSVLGLASFMLHAQNSLFVFLAAGLQDFMKDNGELRISLTQEARLKNTHAQVNEKAMQAGFFNRRQVRASLMDDSLLALSRYPIAAGAG